MRPEFTIRLGTQDPVVFKEVMLQNCYRLPNRFEPGDVIVDVGANIGCFSVMCMIAGCGPVLAVEPHPDNFAVLRRNTAPWNGQVEHRRAALHWRKTSWVPLCDRGPHTAMHCVGPGSGEGIAVTAPRVTLDMLLPKLGDGPPVRLLKLDCEGGEYPGLFETGRLASCQEIIVECHTVEIDGKKWKPQDANAILEANGFELTAVEPDGHAAGNTVLWARNRKL